jgi:hypothetical protein
MNDKSIGSARIEPTEQTTTRVYVERADGESVTLFLEPGNSIAIAEDGPVMVEAYATE